MELPETLLVERAREQFGKVIRKRQEEAKTEEEQAAVKQMLSWDAFQTYLEEERALSLTPTPTLTLTLTLTPTLSLTLTLALTLTLTLTLS